MQMYYRRKVILSLIKLMGNSISKIDLQKLLFIFTKYPKSSKVYDFVPYKYGCFSFQANADLGTLMKYDLIKEEKTEWQLNDFEVNYFDQLTEFDKLSLTALVKHHGKKSTDELIKFTYVNFPYFAINSKVANRHLNDIELQKIEQFKSIATNSALYTIGYEGVSLEYYLNKLIKSDIKLLLDVRKNAKSMKYGFSKNQLKNACEGIGINYIHMPEVGINSDKRQELNTQHDYDILFEDYKDTTLKSTKREQEIIYTYVKDFKRVALTCFEKDICQCHRKSLAEHVVSLSNYQLSLVHI